MKEAQFKNKEFEARVILIYLSYMSDDIEEE